MTARRLVWFGGLIGTATLIGMALFQESFRDAGLILALITIGLTALLAELLHGRPLVVDRPRTKIPEGAQPADGMVDVARIVGIEGIASSEPSRFRRFSRRQEVDLPQSGRIRPGVPPLLGRVVMISIFVGRDGQNWSETEIAAGMAAIERAGIWIERQASRHKAPVNLAVAEVYFQVEDEAEELVEVAFAPDGDEVGPLEANAAIKAVTLASRAAAQLGFADVVDWMNQINQRVDADATAWLFHVRRAGRSLAIDPVISGIPGVGFALCYSREASFPEPLTGKARVDPTTIVHELLHLFGASDKYGMPLGTFPQGSVSPRDVMRLNHDSLSRMQIDGLTASEIGWS